MAKQLKAAILARRAAKAPRKKRTRPKPRQYTIADLERARDRVAAAERRIDNERLNIPYRGRAGLGRAQRELSVIEAPPQSGHQANWSECLASDPKRTWRRAHSGG